MREALAHLLKEAGNPVLMTEAVQGTLAEHALGNYRVLSNLANDLPALGVRKDARQLDETLFFEAFDPKGAAAPNRRKSTAPRPSTM